MRPTIENASTEVLVNVHDSNTLRKGFFKNKKPIELEKRLKFTEAARLKSERHYCKAGS